MPNCKILLFTCFALGNLFLIKPPKGFIIEGTVRGYPDNTILYLADISKGSYDDVDSVKIKGGRFVFKGRLQTAVQYSAIHTRDYNDRVKFWLENEKFTIVTEKGKFGDAHIKGYRVHKEFEEYKAFLKGSEDNQEREKEYIRAYPSTFISAYVLNVYSSTWGKETVSELYSVLAADVKKNQYGKQVGEFIELSRTIRIGDPFVDFSQMDTKGNMVSLSDFIGKVILLEFWGSWCGPCREANPGLVKLYNQYKEKGFEIVGVAADTRKDWWLDAVKKDGLPWTNVCDLRGDKNKAALMYGVSGYPTNYLIDRNGIIINKNLRGKNWKIKWKHSSNKYHSQRPMHLCVRWLFCI